jgi:hypothetical protein
MPLARRERPCAKTRGLASGLDGLNNKALLEAADSDA